VLLGDCTRLVIVGVGVLVVLVTRSIVADCSTVDCGIADCGAADCGAADCGAADCGVADCGTADCGTADCGTADCGVVDYSTASSLGFLFDDKARVNDKANSRLGWLSENIGSVFATLLI